MGLRNCGIMGLWAGERVRASADADGLVGIVRSVVWMDLDIVETLRLYGMASPPHRPRPHCIQQYLAGF